MEVTRSPASNDNVPPAFAMAPIAFLPTATPVVSVVIPVHDRLLYTLQCLQSVATHRIVAPHEIIVVDDGSTDGTAAALDRIRGLRRVSLDANLGFTRACNRGAEAAAGEFLLFLNNDTVTQPGWLDAMVDVARLASVQLLTRRLARA